ncbi:MAG: hypothetical protein BGO05_09675 [Rhizobiales bacterium 63-7]|nr:flagellar hook assembly protein FlgD [Hyphomicrobiales bacterium]OJU72371.1 MAG: hypothetical protein BGO05_09675 [Rhizobiales bacterium 63-7]
MAVGGVTNNTTTPTTTGSKATQAASAASLNYNSFLQLLIAQMKNQDPTSPMDATQQVTQLATFSQVEQSVQQNKNLESLIRSQSLTQASSYIGKTMMSADEKVVGVVQEVQVYSDGLVALTKEGGKILIQPGITITDGSKPTPLGGSSDSKSDSASAADATSGAGSSTNTGTGTGSGNTGDSDTTG